MPPQPDGAAALARNADASNGSPVPTQPRYEAHPTTHELVAPEIDAVSAPVPVARRQYRPAQPTPATNPDSLSVNPAGCVDGGVSARCATTDRMMSSTAVPVGAPADADVPPVPEEDATQVGAAIA